MAIAGRVAMELLNKIGNANAKAEYYLTDAVEIANACGLKASVIETTEDEVRGINTKAQLAEAEAVMQQRLREAAMEAGVTLIAPETVYLSADTKFGKDVVIEPFVVFGPGVEVDDGALVHSFTHAVQTKIGKKAEIGPYARMRPGTVLGEGAKLGNFVETKAAIDRCGRQGQSPELHRRRAYRREGQHRRRRHHLQLRRLRQVSHRDRRGRLRRLELVAGGAGEDRRRRLHRLGRGGDEGCACRRAAHRACGADHQGRLGKTLSRDEDARESCNKESG